jgi:SAM-dependent methyltransferase
LENPVATVERETYLEPYLEATEQYGPGFSALLWASPKTQRARFDAIARAYPVRDKSILDAGCGRADLMGFLLDRNIRPADYIGLEAVAALADVAKKRAYPATRIMCGDFIREPAKFFVGADVVIFSGSLNTISPASFYDTLTRAYDSAAEAVVFNFLSSPALAGKKYLVWHPLERVQGFAMGIAGKVTVIDDYLQGDCTIAMVKVG